MGPKRVKYKPNLNPTQQAQIGSTFNTMESQSFSSSNSQFPNTRTPIQRQHGCFNQPFNPSFNHSQEWGRFYVPFNPPFHGFNPLCNPPRFHYTQEQGWFYEPFNPPFHEQGWFYEPLNPPFHEQGWFNIPFNPPFHEHGQINLRYLPAVYMGAPSAPITGFIPFGGQQHSFPNVYNCAYPFNHFSNSYHYTGHTSLQQDQNISNTREALVDQIEYYFSDANLDKHEFLRRQMDSEGWVSVELLARFQRVKQLTQDIKLILKALESSDFLEVKGNKMRRRNEWKVQILPDGASTSTHPTPYGSSCPISSNPTMQMTSIQNLRLDGDSKAEPAEAKSPTVGSHLNNTSIDAQGEIKLRTGSTSVPDVLEKSDQKGLESTVFNN